MNEKNTETNPYADQINTLRSTAIQTINYDKVNEFTNLTVHQEFLLKLLTNKDSFVRKKIIDQNISYLNHRLSYYIDKIGLPHKVTFENDLSVNITELGREMDFFNLSRGEMTRLTLSLSFAFRDCYESLNTTINLLCIDELLDGGLDTIGIENTLSILKTFSRDHNKNILLVSHREELIGRVNSVLTVTKEGGYTSFENDI